MSENKQPDYDDFTKQILEQYNEIAQLAGALAHEIKNPLSVIRMNVDLLAEDHEGSTPPDQRRTLDKIKILQAQCERLQNLLDDFLPPGTELVHGIHGDVVTTAAHTLDPPPSGPLAMETPAAYWLWTQMMSQELTNSGTTHDEIADFNHQHGVMDGPGDWLVPETAPDYAPSSSCWGKSNP